MTKSPNEIDVRIGAEIKRRRTILGISQTVLGDAVDVTFQQIQKYERGTNRVSGSKLVQISKVLGCKTSDLTGDDDANENIQPVQRLSSSALRVAAAFDRIPDDKQRRHVASLINSMSGQHEAA